MDVNKVLYISQEISPYLPETPMSVMSRQLPQAVQEQGVEVRPFMPKYGYINGRRNQLHEVIRLSGMNIIIDDTDHPLVIKVATLQPAHMQVYFIFNEDYFLNTITKNADKSFREQLETATSPADNDERSIFFVRGALETVKKQLWVPQVIHCSGVIAALAPLYIRDFYRNDPSFRDVKVVYSLFDDDFVEPLSDKLYGKLKFDGLKEANIKALKGKAADKLELTRLALAHSDGVALCSPDLSPELLELVEKSKLPVMPYSEDKIDGTAWVDFYKSL